MSAAALLRDVRRMARDRYAWPGGYALALVMTDGGILCPNCVRAEYRQIIRATRDGSRDGWGAAGVDHAGNWDDPETCDHCGATIGGAE